MISYSLNLYAITDKSWLAPGEKLWDKVEEAILGGATIVQYRQKSGSASEKEEEAREIYKVCRRYHVPFIINDDVELAKALDADGVHVGQSDMAVAEARKMLGPDKIIGATAKTVLQAKEACAAGADYLGSGAVFGSTTKTDAIPMRKELLQEICESVNIPVVAIGGIDDTNVELLRGMPIAGVAVVSGLFAKNNIMAAALRIRELFEGRPVVQCITNHVTVNDVANMVLITKASPIMAHHANEAEEVQNQADALLLNLGATDDYIAMKLAVTAAKRKKHPVIIDPVGCSVSKFRREFFHELVTLVNPTCIRGNYAEIQALYEDVHTSKGLEACGTAESAMQYGKLLARKLGCIVVASGPVDIITDGENLYSSASGHAMQRELTGSGCVLTAAIASALSRVKQPSAAMVAKICDFMGDTAAEVANKVIDEKRGAMEFRTQWFDALYSKYTY